jgi:hypothetical protein
VMRARRRAPNHGVGNLHAELAVERDRSVHVAANEVYLVEGLACS